MGEAAEDALDGSCCECCGEWFGDIIDGGMPPGYPRRCAGCGGAPEGGKRSAKRRRSNARKAVRAEAARHGAHDTLLALGFKQMGNPWHYQIKVPGQPAIDFWPSKQKRCMRNQVTRCTVDELRVFIANLSRAGAAL